MGLATFIRRALVLSVNVTLRMSLMLATSGFILFMIFAFLRDQPLGLLLALVLTLFPGLVFLYLSCVRAGLVAIKESGPPDLKKLGIATLKLFRFSIMLNNLTMTLIGLGGSVLFMMALTPDIWSDLKEGFEISDLGDVTEVLARLSQMPLGIFLVLTLGLSVSNGIIGTSSAAVAASAADKGPNHHALWGVTRQFFPLFTLSMLVLWLPALLLIFYLGGPLEPLSSLARLNIIALICIPLFLIWAGCAICAGKALAYSMTRKELADEWDQEREGLLGEVVPETNLRELRLKRQEANRLRDQQDKADEAETRTPVEPERPADGIEEPATIEKPAPDVPEPEPPLGVAETKSAETAEPDPTETTEPAEIQEVQTEEDFRRLVEERMAADAEAKRKLAAKAKRQAATVKKKAAPKTRARTRTKSRVTKVRPTTKRKAITKTKT